MVPLRPGKDVLRSVRHFLWYLDYHSKNGPGSYPTRSARVHLGVTKTDREAAERGARDTRGES